MSSTTSNNLTKHGGFGERFLEAFEPMGWNQAEIARRLGVSRPTVADYAGGRLPPAQTLITIVELTDCSLDWLVLGKGPKYVQNNNDQEAGHLALIRLTPAVRDALSILVRARQSTINEQIAEALWLGLLGSIKEMRDPFLGLIWEVIEAPSASKRTSRRRKAGGSK